MDTVDKSDGSVRNWGEVWKPISPILAAPTWYMAIC